MRTTLHNVVPARRWSLSPRRHLRDLLPMAKALASLFLAPPPQPLAALLASAAQPGPLEPPQPLPSAQRVWACLALSLLPPQWALGLLRQRSEPLGLLLVPLGVGRHLPQPLLAALGLGLLLPLAPWRALVPLPHLEPLVLQLRGLLVPQLPQEPLVPLLLVPSGLSVLRQPLGLQPLHSGLPLQPLAVALAPRPRLRLVLRLEPPQPLPSARRVSACLALLPLPPQWASGPLRQRSEALGLLLVPLEAGPRLLRRPWLAPLGRWLLHPLAQWPRPLAEGLGALGRLPPRLPLEARVRLGLRQE